MFALEIAGFAYSEKCPTPVWRPAPLAIRFLVLLRHPTWSALFFKSDLTACRQQSAPHAHLLKVQHHVQGSSTQAAERLNADQLHAETAASHPQLNFSVAIVLCRCHVAVVLLIAGKKTAFILHSNSELQITWFYLSACFYWTLVICRTYRFVPALFKRDGRRCYGVTVYGPRQSPAMFHCPAGMCWWPSAWTRSETLQPRVPQTYCTMTPLLTWLDCCQIHPSV